MILLILKNTVTELNERQELGRVVRLNGIVFNDNQELIAYLWGRDLRNYILVKDDKVIELHPDLTELEKRLQ